MNKDNSLKFFMYCRKSSEDDRQAASIGDQLRELSPVLEREKLKLEAEPFTEEKSAKGPGRPTFNEMLKRIERGEANAIICWDIDRLYRNPVDEGRVRWLLQHGVIQQICTPHRTFYPQDAGLLMGVEGGRATDHIITLRKGVFRGFRGKLEKGHRPGVAPPGYLNDMSKEKGERIVIPDPERFDLIRRGWDLMLTGHYSVRQIQKVAADEWGLRSRKSKKLGGRPYSISAWYRLFTDPFYSGCFWWKTPETSTRELYKGAHVPMITPVEFDQVQILLGRKGKPVPKTHRFAFTGLVRCGECRAMVTAETKHQIICSTCHLKFSAPNKDVCPRCGTKIEAMVNPKRLTYTYYHCTKRKNPSCPQGSISDAELEGQIDQALGTITISETFKEWAIKALREDQHRESDTRRNADDGLRQQHGQVKRQLQHINSLILSLDTDWALISREEVKEEKARLVEELRRIEQQLEGSGKTGRDGPELTERTFEFAAYARFWFREGDLDQRRAIFSALGSNPVLRDKKLALELQKPLRYVAEMVNAVPAVSGTFEPEKRRSGKTKSPPFASGIPCLRRGMNAIRTYWLKTIGAKPLPIFPIRSTQDTKKRRRGKRWNFAA